MRKEPKQARSLKRVNLILDTAAHIFAETGIENATTNQIAAEAGVSIGSLYQFFPNKDSIVEALSDRYVQELRDLNRRLFDPTINADLSLTEIIDQLIINIAQFEAEHAGFDVLFGPSQATNSEIHLEVVDLVTRMMAHHFPNLPVDSLHAAATMNVAIVKSLKPVTSPPDNLPPEQAVHEIRSALMGYIRSVLIRHNIPLPDDLT